ncbi:MOSC N-terminal beta barrel domain-containing protein [Fibrella sp. HMF5335]|uniref:MOSC N-terminal beta barrel domain-containing protein n=1 Tax=Fibrella rubiginis TaxID=2817060 RepID=A0A939GH22_9BACT|nr:MOSC N-terminal beta barrel domain-containing protein [Fibrella rubiginis]MBO0936660.1 MOSC N-terminal beta barrel domain-containing protein [Fibrella rubiginis]
MLTVSQLFVFPVKSLAGFPVPAAVVTDRGLQHDRRWMLVDAHNQFLTLREYPKMALLHTALIDNQLVVTSGEQPASPLTIPIRDDNGDGEDVTIWNATVRARSEGKEAADWFSDVLGGYCKLVFMPESSNRPVDTTSGYHPAGKLTSFADAYPFLLLGEASMNELNSRLPEPYSILRFRPNIVFAGGTPYQEDEIEHFTINGISFTGLENCARCKIPNVDPATGMVSPTNQPLKTLAGYRNVNRNIIFGRNTVHSGTGTIRVGDALILQ